MIHVQAYFDDTTNTVSYLVEDTATQQAVLIDPVLASPTASKMPDANSPTLLMRHITALTILLPW